MILNYLLQYVVEALFHACRLLSYGDKQHVARPLYRLHDLLFLLARLGSISLAVLVFWYGLAQAPKEHQQEVLIGGGACCVGSKAIFTLSWLTFIGGKSRRASDSLE